LVGVGDDEWFWGVVWECEFGFDFFCVVVEDGL